MPISQDIIDLHDSFTHGLIDRRQFMERLATTCGGVAAATAMLSKLQNDHAKAEMVSEGLPGLETRSVAYPSPSGDVAAYVAAMQTTERRPAVIVIHENRGLNAHIKDVARRIALERFVAIAPDLLSPSGGTPADEDVARDMIGKLDAAKTTAALVAAVAFAKGLAGSTGKIGAVGFCWGGGMANQLAVAAPLLNAAVAYYGPQPAPADVPRIKAALLLHYAGNDERINAGITGFEAALKAAGTDYQLYKYERAQHAFNNDTSAARYDKVAAGLAWGRTIAFLKAKLAA